MKYEDLIKQYHNFIYHDFKIIDSDESLEVIFNFEEVKYMSSSGIRVLVGTSKKVNNNMKILKPTDEVMEVFTITGLVTKFNIEK